MARSIVIEFLGKDKSLGSTAGQVDGKMSKLGGKLAKFGKVAALGLAAAGAAAVVVGKKLVDAGERAGTANARIENIASSMNLFGEEAGKVSDRLVKLAEATALQTGMDQNAIKETQAKLLTFKDLAKSADEVGGSFDRATQAAIDMEASGFGNASSNAVQLGKALNDPIKGITALAKSGVTFTETEKERIKTLVESGKAGQAQAKILRAIETQVGGTAEATANGTDKMRVVFSQLTEQIGMKLVPVVDRFATWLINVGMPALENFGKAVQKHILPPLSRAIGFIRDRILPIFSRFGSEGPSALDKLRAAVKPVVDAVRGLAAAVRPIVTQVVAHIQKNWGPISGWARKNFGQVRQVVSGVFQLIAAVVKRVTQVVSAIWKRHGADILAVTTRVFRALGQVISGALQVIRGIIRTVTSVIKGDWSGAWSGIKMIFSGAWKAMKAIVSLAWDGIKAVISRGISSTVDYVRGLPGRIKSALGNLSSLLWSAGSSIIQGLIDGIQSKVSSLTSKLGEITRLIPKVKGPINKDRILLKPAGVAIMEGLIRGINSKKRDLEFVLGKITAFVQRSGDKLARLVQDRRSFAAGFSGFSSSVFGADLGLGEGSSGSVAGRSRTGLSDLDLDPAAQGGAQVGGVAAMLAFQREQQAKAVQLRRNVRQLLKKGISEDLLRQLQASGESGIEQISALAGASKRDIRQLNASNAATNRALRGAGASAAGALYTDDIREARRANTLAKAIRKELAQMRRQQDENTVVQLVIDGRVLRTSLLALKRKSGTSLGLG